MQNNLEKKHAKMKNRKANNQPKSQHIARIDAWTWSNAYACVPFFTHMARAFGVISLDDWVLEL